MELYGIVGNAQRKATPKGRELLEVAFYSLDMETQEGKNQIIQIAFWENIERYEKLITKGARLRVFVDKLRANPQIDKNGNPVVYFNANGQAFVYVNTGNTGNSGSAGSSDSQSRNMNTQQNQNTTSQNNNTQNTYNNNQPSQNNNQSQTNQTPNNTNQKPTPNPANEQMTDIEDFLNSI